MIQHFTQGPPGVVQKLNELINEVNKVSQIVGDGIVQVQRSPQGMTIGINREQLAALVPKIVTSEGLLARYLFNNNLLDSSGNGHDGTAGGGLASTRYIAEFDGDDDDVDCGSDFIGVKPLTIFARIRPLDAGESQWGRIVDNGKAFLSTYLDATRYLLFTSDGTSPAISAASALTWNKWQDVAVTRTAAGVANLYVNGVLTGAANQASGTPVAGTSNVFIGNNSAGAYTFNGGMDDVRIYNKIMTAAEIRRVTDERARIYSHANEFYGRGTTWRARTTEVAPAATNITCNLIIDDGLEAASGEFGFEIEVYCDICGGGNLDSALPALDDDEYLSVYQSWHTDGTYRWYAETTFQARIECTCT